EFRWQHLLYAAGHDPDGFDPDAPLPPELYGRPKPAGRARRLYEAAREHPGLPLRELARLLPATGPPGFVGTPEQLADHIIAWQDAGAADGFTIMGATLPRELAVFVDRVVPILQARGRYRTGYSGHTLRDHLGLARPLATRLQAGRLTPACLQRRSAPGMPACSRSSGSTRVPSSLTPSASVRPCGVPKSTRPAPASMTARACATTCSGVPLNANRSSTSSGIRAPAAASFPVATSSAIAET